MSTRRDDDDDHNPFGDKPAAPAKAPRPAPDPGVFDDPFGTDADDHWDEPDTGAGSKNA